MSKYVLLVFVLFFSSLSFGQNIVLEGNIADESSQLPIDAATVYVSNAKDAALIDYTISDKKGKFSLSLKKLQSPATLKISMMGFEDFILDLKSIQKAVDFGRILLKAESKMLGEVVIKSEAPPIRFKKDTLEFNAASFKVRPDANVQTLLKQLPGVEIDSDGKITVNGKEVNQILVNGKPFFDKDGKVALQNLPSEIINKVQISDTKTKKEELSGQQASGNNASINLTIDEKKNKGYFGKFTAGYGSDKRYESSGLFNYFKNKRKISVLASSNNINSIGFSMDEIFDNMGGGRNSVYGTGNGSFNAGGVQYGGATGITRSDLVGVSYSDEWAKGLDNASNYFFSNTNNENSNATRQASLLPDGTFITTSGFKAKTDQFSHNVNLDFEYKIDSTMTLSVMPKFYKANSKSRQDSFQTSEDDKGLLNQSKASTLNDNDASNFKNAIIFNKAFRRKGRNLSVGMNNDNTKNQNENTNNSITSFYQQQKPDDIRNQKIGQRNLTDNYDFNFEYVEPITDSLSVTVGTIYSKQNLSNDTKTFDFDSATNAYSSQNDLLTNYISSDLSKWAPKAGVYFNKKKFSGQLSGGTYMIDFDNHSLYLGNTTDLNKNYIYPFMSAYGNYKITKSKNVWVYYGYDVSTPNAAQILPVLNLVNPLNTYIGNPNLKPTSTHNFNFNFYDYDYATRTGWSTWGGMNYFDNQVVASTTYDESKKATTTYLNVSGTYTSYLGAYWSKIFKKEAYKFTLATGLTSNYNLSKGFTNAVQYDASALSLIPGVRINYDYGEILSIVPAYNYTYIDTRYTNYAVDKTSNFVHKFNLQTTSYWPKNWVFGNDFGYTFNSNLSAGFRKDFYLWNTSLAYNFYDKKFTAKVKVYDILNQNQSASRTITPTTVIDQQNTVLKRYVMFSLTYNIGKFGEKKSSN